MKHQSIVSNVNSISRRKDARAYVSPLRVEQAAQTRLRIIQAYGDELCGGEREEVTVQQVAARAGVSVPTLYRNFPSLEVLGDAYWAWVEPQLATFATIESADDLPLFAQRLFEQFDAHEPLIRAMLVSRSGRRLRHRSVQRRNQGFQRALAPLTRRMPEREALSVAAICKVVSSGYVWHLMRDDWGLDGSEAGRAVAWALRVLIDAIRKNPRPLKREKGSGK
jgi:AcrR family transcriptional regulator